jgi:hypothetical protein
MLHQTINWICYEKQNFSIWIVLYEGEGRAVNECIVGERKGKRREKQRKQKKLTTEEHKTLK